MLVLNAFAWRRRAAVALVSVLAACTGASSGGGGAGPDGGPSGGGGPAAPPITVGPNLDQPLGLANTFGCADGYPVQTNPTFPQPFLAPGSSSCLVLTFVANPDQKALRSGVAVSATVRVGAITGPMRFVRMRILYNRTASPKCCSLEQYGEVFTPTADTATTVPLGFPMTFDPLPSAGDLDSIAANDLLAMEVLAPNVPIPGFWTKNGGPDLGTASYEWLPALSVQKVPAPSGQLLSYTGSYSGFVPSFTFAYVEN